MHQEYVEIFKDLIEELDASHHILEYNFINECIKDIMIKYS